jgi:hypothetical protein
MQNGRPVRCRSPFQFQRSRLVRYGQSLEVPAGEENNHHCSGYGRDGVCSVDGLHHSGSRPGDFELVGGGRIARVAVGYLEDGTGDLKVFGWVAQLVERSKAKIFRKIAGSIPAPVFLPPPLRPSS